MEIVAGGHKQVEGINYTETFSAAVKAPTVRVVLANAAERDCEIHQIDVKSAYLQAPLKETIYEAAAWSFEARAGGQGLPPSTGALRP